MPVRNLLYLYANTAEKHVVCHGVDFKCFLRCLEKPLNNILLIKHGYDGKNFNSRSGFTYVTEGEIKKLAEDDIDKYGDFCWVDFEEEFAPDRLTRLDIAELLYFGHKHRPFSSPVFTRLRNRFAYWSHDDGWYSSLYFTDSGEMQSFMSRAVAVVARSKHLTAGKIQSETAKEIFSMSERGLLLDTGELREADDMIVLPFYVTGKITDLNDAVNNTAKYKENAVKKGTFRFRKKAAEKPKVPFWRRRHKKS
ncbi:MAG: hypothetical protein GX847_06315 [Clostridiales bacterium]|nr:hypothetical protein [Clostridiales bacterium]